MKWQPVHERKKLGLALLEEERLQETAIDGLKKLFKETELKPIEATTGEIEPGMKAPYAAMAENVRNIKGGRKSAKTQLVNAGNSALVQTQQAGQVQ